MSVRNMTKRGIPWYQLSKSASLSVGPTKNGVGAA